MSSLLRRSVAGRRAAVDCGPARPGERRSPRRVSVQRRSGARRRRDACAGAARPAASRPGPDLAARRRSRPHARAPAVRVFFEERLVLPSRAACLAHDREPVRLAAAFARSRSTVKSGRATSRRTRARGARAYAAPPRDVAAAHRRAGRKPRRPSGGDPDRADGVGEAGRLGLIDAIADLSPTARLQAASSASWRTAPVDARRGLAGRVRPRSLRPTRDRGCPAADSRSLRYRDGRRPCAPRWPRLETRPVVMLREALASTLT